MRILLITLIFLISGCATIIDGREQTIVFNSSPEGASVVVGGVTLGKTPLNVPVKRSNSNQGVRFTLDGYETLEVPLISDFNPITLINHPFGTTTDIVTGAAYKYSPGAYIVTLKPTGNRQAEFTTFERKIFEFILMNYNEISKEVCGNSGSNIDSLSKLSKISDKSEIKNTLKLIITNSENAPEAARAFIKSIQN